MREKFDLWSRDDVVEHSVRSRLDHVLDRLRQVNEEGRQTVQGLRAQPSAILMPVR